jgi:hypothetical protein
MNIAADSEHQTLIGCAGADTCHWHSAYRLAHVVIARHDKQLLRLRCAAAAVRPQDLDAAAGNQQHLANAGQRIRIRILHVSNQFCNEKWRSNIAFCKSCSLHCC